MSETTLEDQQEPRSCGPQTQPSLSEVEELKIDYERGFYVEFRNGKLHAGRGSVEGVRVIGVLDDEG